MVTLGTDPPPPPVTVSAFITPQSLVSFPIASLVVRLLWSVADKLVPGALANNWVGLGIALVIGLLVYLLSISDGTLAMTRKQKAIGIAIATINSLVLFAAAAGIAATPAPADGATPSAAGGAGQ